MCSKVGFGIDVDATRLMWAVACICGMVGFEIEFGACKVWRASGGLRV